MVRGFPWGPAGRMRASSGPTYGPSWGSCTSPERGLAEYLQEASEDRGKSVGWRCGGMQVPVPLCPA